MDRPQIQGLSEWRPLARGGLAVVWQARQLSLNRLVAVKVYQSELSRDDRRCFLREAAAAGRLSDHRGVVTAHAAGILPDDRPYLIMELCPGGSLSQWLIPENRLSAERVRQIGVRIADTLAAVHACGVLHRDVKPANILIDRFGNPRLADFGLAASAGTETGAAEAMGMTPAYAPPEALGGQSATEAGDVFSLAATLYALLAGSPPSIALGPTIEVAWSSIKPLAGVDEYLGYVLTTAMSPDRAARPTAAEFRDQLAKVPSPGVSPRVVLGAGDNPSVPSRGRISVGAAIAAEQPRGPVVSAEVRRGKGRRGKGRRGTILSLAAAVVTVVAATTVWVVHEPRAPSAIPSGLPSAFPSRVPDTGPTTSTRSGADRDADSGSVEQETISVQGSTESARPFQTVPISGTYRGGADAFVQVQRWEQGKWLAFPLPARTDQSGDFTAYVELGQPSRYRLRVHDPDSGVTSEPFVLAIKG